MPEGLVVSVVTEMEEVMAQLTPVQQKFILHWGEMGTKWGINRTVAQIHALLFVSDHPLHAEEIADTLAVARSNVSNSLKELQAWGIVKRVHVMGDKRDHFESIKDVWEMFRLVADERKRRELDPTLAMLRECLEHPGAEKDAYTQERLRDLSEFFETTGNLYQQIRSWPASAVAKFARLGERALKMLGLGGK